MSVGILNLTKRSVLSIFRVDFDKALTNRWWSGIAQRIQSDQAKSETHDWLGGVPQMSEQTGDPKFAQMRVNEFTIRNKPWQSGVEVPKAAWLHQKGDVITTKVAELVDVAAAHPGELIQTLISQGENTVCYDGQYYFDTDHAEGDSGTQSNDLTASATTPSAPTASETVDAILKAVVAIWSYKDDKGNGVNVSARQFMVCSGPTIFPSVLKAVNQELIGSGESNVVVDNKKFTLVPQILPNLTGNKLYLFRSDAPNGKPFIYQILDEIEPYVLDENSEYCKIHGKLLFGASGNYNVGYGRWQGACLVTFT